MNARLYTLSEVADEVRKATAGSLATITRLTAENKALRDSWIGRTYEVTDEIDAYAQRLMECSR